MTQDILFLRIDGQKFFNEGSEIYKQENYCRIIYKGENGKTT